MPVDAEYDRNIGNLIDAHDVGDEDEMARLCGYFLETLTARRDALAVQRVQVQAIIDDCDWRLEHPYRSLFRRRR